MSSKKTFVVALICVALLVCTTYVLYALRFPSPDDPGEFDEEAFQQKVAEIEAQYMEHQDLLQSIVQAFWDDDTIEGIRVEEKSGLWLSDGKTDAFEEDYPQLYDTVYQLWTSDFYTTSFSRSDEQENIVVCFITAERYYRGPFMTDFRLYFYYGDLPEAIYSDYRKQLSDNCWLVVRHYVLE